MKTLITFLSLVASIVSSAQHDHATGKTSKKWDNKTIFNQVFTDSSFAGKEIKVGLFTVPAGAIDTITHIHDCHLIGYILEGEVMTKLKNKAPQRLKAGDIFYEFPNEVHESLQNLNKDVDAKILLYYVYNSGATLYKKLYEK
ncbi:MAG TPA: cupin domain-containing protein [Chitinophagaceae bacterium]|nr:cupin domain-containing protein [Chitinophagaceae bacterium]